MNASDSAEPVATRQPSIESGFNVAELDRKSLGRLRRSSRALFALGWLYFGLALVLSIFSFGPMVAQGMITLAGFLRYLILLSFLGATAYSFVVRPTWGRVFGYVSMSLALLVYPLGTLFGLLGILALVRGGDLFGKDGVRHQLIEQEWKARRKRGAASATRTDS